MLFCSRLEPQQMLTKQLRTYLGSLLLSCRARFAMRVCITSDWKQMLQAGRRLLQYAIHLVKRGESDLASQGG